MKRRDFADHVRRSVDAALIVACLLLATPLHARAATTDSQTPVLAPMKAFAAAFNAGSRSFPTTAFTEDCTTIDEFDPFEWHGKGSIRHFLQAHEILTLEGTRMLRRRGSNAYVVLSTRLQYAQMGKTRLQHLDWAAAEVHTPAGWRIAAQAWALLDDTAAQPVSETRVPFRIDRGVIVFQARVNDRGPFDFTFDPGAQGVLTSVAANPLGLKSGSTAKVQSLRIGDAEIHNVSLPVYAGSPADVFAASPGEPAIAGALGPEILNRFAVRLDYQVHAMTLTPLETFVYKGPGVAVPFTIQSDNIPLIAATVDGVPGLFQYDVRARPGLYLFAPFLERSGLSQRFPTGSNNVATLTVAQKTLENVAARVGPARSGPISAATEAGLLGYGVLSQFTTTIDYRRKVIYFEAL
ncbi:MAG TPA: hypothetical protein VFW34_04000 [Candidatus Rubrimentiphilum sp.]|nr:hypothetical protein [Candidatus Rubrimentiphilum sp.]